MLCMADGVELLAGILAAMRIGAVPVPVSTMVTGADLGVLLARLAGPGAVRVGGVRRRRRGGRAGGRARGRRGRARRRPADRDGRASGATCARRASLDGAVPDVAGLARVVAVHLRHHRQAEGRHAPARRVREVARAYGRGRCSASGRTTGACPWPSCSSPTGWATRRSSRSPSARRRCWSAPGRRRALIAERAAARAADAVLRRADVLRGAARTPTCPPTRSPRCGRRSRPASRCPPVLFQRFRERFGVEILDGIGSTEALHIFLSNRPGQVRPGTTGIPVPGYDVRIRDEHGAPRSARAAGRPVRARRLDGHRLLVPHGDHARGVPGRVAAHRRHLRAQRGRHYTCLGRSDDMLKAGGIWVSPAEVEERLLEHPDVAEAVVVAAPDADGLDKPVACVVPVAGPEVDPDELVAVLPRGAGRVQAAARGGRRWPSCRTRRPARSAATCCASWSRRRRPTPRGGAHLMLDGMPLVDAHVHAPRLSTLKPAWREWAMDFGGPVRLARRTPRPAIRSRPRWTPWSSPRAWTVRCCSASTARGPPASSRSRTSCRWSRTTRRGSGWWPTSTRTCTTRLASEVERQLSTWVRWR